MNNKKSIIVSIALAATMLATSLSAFAYTDVSENHWAKPYIDDMSGKKYISGYEDSTYRPDDYITVAEFAKILVNISGAIDKANVTLPDVNDSAWYADTMQIAVKAGYLNGYEDGTFRPEEYITRQRAIVMIYRAWQLTPEGTLGFADNYQIADWAANEIATLAAKNVAQGYPDGTFRPLNNITRAEAAKLLSLALTLGNITGTQSANTNTGVTSGALHVGSASSNSDSGTVTASSTGGKGGTSGGSGGGGGGGSTDTTKTATSDMDINVDTKAAANTIGGLNDDVVADTDPYALHIDVKNVKSGKPEVTYTDPATGEEVTKTVDEFNEEMAKGEFTKEDCEKILENPIVVTIPKGSKYTGTVKATVTAETPESINYVIIAMNEYRNGKGTEEGLAVIFNDAVDGYDSKKTDCDKYLEDNAAKKKIYMEIATLCAKSFAEADESNYKDYEDYFTAMTKVVDEAAQYAAENAPLTEASIKEYYETVKANIATELEGKTYVAEVQEAAKQFALIHLDEFEALNEALANAADDADKIQIVFDTFNAADAE